MHELSIAQSIVELAEKQARQHKAKSIEEVELEIGRLAGVERSALKFALKSAVKGTMLENARIVWRDIYGEGRCLNCGAVFVVSDLFPRCPFCGLYVVNILQGTELRLKSLVIK